MGNKLEHTNRISRKKLMAKQDSKPMDLSSRQIVTASQSLIDGLNEFSDALAARDDTFHCDRRNIWGDRISIQLVRKAAAGRI